MDAYMSSLKNSLVGKSGVEIEKTQKTDKGDKVSVVVATRVAATKGKGTARGELVEANQDEPEWSSESDDETLGETLQTWTQKQRKLLGKYSNRLGL